MLLRASCRSGSRSLSSLLLFITFAIVLVHANPVNYTVGNEDPVLQWSPSVCDALPPNICPGQWWQSRGTGYANGTVHTNSGGPNCCSVTLKFRGSAIYWYTTKFPGGGTAKITIDSVTTSLVPTDQPESQYRVLVFQQEGLDPSSDHTLSLSYVDGSFLDVDYFSILGDDSNFVGPVTGAGTLPSGSTPSSTVSNRPSTTGDASGTAKLDAGSIAGIAIGGTTGLFLIILGACFFIRRRARSQQRPPGLIVDSPMMQQQQPPGHHPIHVQGPSTYTYQPYRPAPFASSSVTGSSDVPTSHAQSSVGPLMTNSNPSQNVDPPAPPMSPATMGRIVDLVLERYHDIPPAYQQR